MWFFLPQTKRRESMDVIANADVVLNPFQMAGLAAFLSFFGGLGASLRSEPWDWRHSIATSINTAIQGAAIGFVGYWWTLETPNKAWLFIGAALFLSLAGLSGIDLAQRLFARYISSHFKNGGTKDDKE